MKFLKSIDGWCIQIFLSLLFVGCSYHYDQGMKLESEERWEEAAIEYHRAYVDDSDDINVLEALKRVNRRVAQENFELYNDYLEKREYRKAFTCLKNALIQNPELDAAFQELKHWKSILLTGKLELAFDRLGRNLRLAEKMKLEVRINSPSGKVINGEVSYKSGIFILEDLLYKMPSEKLSEYTLNAIGLQLTRRNSRNFSREEFMRFINFRTLIPGSVEGGFSANSSKMKNIYEHRSTFFDKNSTSLDPWFPPRLVRYKLQVDDEQIRVITKHGRREFAPDWLYLNDNGGRAYIDFGILELEQNEKSRKWSIRRKSNAHSAGDYFKELSRNLSINRYFSYERVYRFVY